MDDKELQVLPASGPMLTRKDFVSDQMVKWCPGCGDYAILAAVQKLMPTLGVPKEKIVFVSGIGCSSRFPYYMNTFGFHSIHGRAPTIATGIKAARSDMQVWLVTGDGDALSIGGNHLLHTLRRNVDLKILLFNNRIYGLTKGQASPTSEFGKKTKSTPQGTVDYPINPISIALASEATFVARAVDNDVVGLPEVLKRAAMHKGSAFVEILQNCIVFNDAAWEKVENKETRDDNMVRLEHGKPLIFGKDKNKGIRLNGFEPEVVVFDKANPPKDLLLHDEKMQSPNLAYILSEFTERENYPIPTGVFRQVERATLSDLMDKQVSDAKKASAPDLQKLLNGAENWVVA